jgi:hypothetical protein
LLQAKTILILLPFSRKDGFNPPLPANIARNRIVTHQ